MQILSLNFLIHTFCGIWRPIEWSSNGAKLLYSIFTCGVISSEYFMVLTQFMDIVLVVDNIDDFTANTLLFLSMVNVCCKATFVVIRRNAIIDVVGSLLKAPHKPRNEDEVAIQTKFDKFIRRYTITYGLIMTSSIIAITTGSILKDVGMDTLIFGLFLQTCAQLEIFESRLHKLIINKTIRDLGRKLSTSNKDEMEISEIVRHHLIIYKYAKTVNTIYNQVIFFQFFESILVLCTCIYYLTMYINELFALANFLAYTLCMFLQIYIYCWSANEVILKSTSVGDAIYCTDWPLLPVNEQKNLLLIMMRTTIPITFTSSFLITLSLESYGSILKASYSAFNVLTQ
ncbi:odorant receptor 46a-like isoform X2 [Temnothorax longispinosus]|uniref:odorant receptor 46a-like isoform X2 n=1 Tax=Temnothorax longispinosus TaxID=300112 RepID=UPI003A9A4831